MNMKKTRGFVDPFTLGFILAGVIAAGGVATEKAQSNAAKAQSQNTTYTAQATTRQKPATAKWDNDPFVR